jgi:hypothetical protein
LRRARHKPVLIQYVRLKQFSLALSGMLMSGCGTMSIAWLAASHGADNDARPTVDTDPASTLHGMEAGTQT